MSGRSLTKDRQMGLTYNQISEKNISKSDHSGEEGAQKKGTGDLKGGRIQLRLKRLRLRPIVD